MSLDAKPLAEVRLQIGGRPIEIKGDQDFVREMFKEVKELILAVGDQGSPQTIQQEDADKSSARSPRSRTPRATSRTTGTVIPVDIAPPGQPSLADFMAEKKPPQTSERLVIFFTYYLTKHAGIAAVLPGHLMYCFEQLGIKKPTNISATIVNAKQRAKLVVTGGEPNSLVCNIAGENWVKFSLPPKENPAT